MRCSLGILVWACALSAMLSAQISVAARTGTRGWNVQASIGGATSNGLPPNTVLAPPAVTVGTTATGTYGSATSEVRVAFPASAIGTLQLALHRWNSMHFWQSVATTSGSGDVQFVLTAPAPVPVLVRVQAWPGYSNFLGSGGSVSVDVGGDGSQEITLTAQSPAFDGTFPAVVDPSGLKIDAAVDHRLTFTQAASTQGFGATVTLDVSPRNVLQRLGLPCAASVTAGYAASAQNETFTVAVTSAPGMPGVLVAGAGPTYVPLLPGPCLLLVAPTLLAPFVTDAGGSAALRFDVPWQGAPILFQMQAAVLAPGGMLATSEVLHVR